MEETTTTAGKINEDWTREEGAENSPPEINAAVWTREEKDNNDNNDQKEANWIIECCVDSRGSVWKSLPEIN